MSASQIPAGKTWFDTHKVSFENVPIGADQGISTSEFLDASEATTTLFDVLGSVAFTPVKNDMLGNIKKVRERQLAAPEGSSTLQSLVKTELASKSHKATEGLLWLVRGLDFTAQALRADLTSNAGVSTTAQKPTKELSESFRAAYKNTLAPHHGFLVKPIFSAAMSATPYRKDMYSRLVGEGTNPETASQALEKWVAALEQRVGILKTFLASPEGKW
ncbi:pleckstrin domain containing, family A member 8 [Exophiala viscosa]|uniref:Pleckstrin domain containing, family A member 8 n=1 Tax=Exophiala viscosa TaxID=2486360 RepID=A0AAN6DUZ6_9EURO|nr:pleckstrin domain containing, family A member 8 [Exophiala viscosa]